MIPVAFDAYGTLFDVHGLETRLETLFPGKGGAISRLWRVRQIDYARLTTLSGHWRGFLALTGDALDYACEAEGAALAPEARADLLTAYETLPPHLKSRPLRRLHADGRKLAVLTNGDPDMVGKALAAAGVADLFAHVLTAAQVRRFKTAPECYALAPRAFGVPAGEIVFVSSNGWDAVAGAAYGFRAFWINRTGAPRERYGGALAGEGRTLEDLPGFLNRSGSA